MAQNRNACMVQLGRALSAADSLAALEDGLTTQQRNTVETLSRELLAKHPYWGYAAARKAAVQMVRAEDR